MIDISKARKNLDARYAAARQRSLERFKKATDDCSEIVSLIASKYHPVKIFQWGSLLYPERFNENSDIDIAVEGITDAETFFNMLGDAMKLTKLPLDIVQIERIEPEFAEGIRESGRVVYERT
jgi:predicted nucleotidyltransferase